MKLFGAVLAAVAAALLGSVVIALAVDLPARRNISNGLPVERPNRDYNSLVVNGWLFQPALFAGAVYDSNINQTASNRVSAFGERIVPSFTGYLNNGIHQTNVYGLLDARFYQAAGANDDTQVAAKAGVGHTYEAMRDLTFRAGLDYTRQQDVFSSWSFVQHAPPSGTVTTALASPTAISPQTNPTFFNQFTGSLSATKTFGRAFVSAGFTAQHTQFDRNPFGNRDGTVYTVPVRVAFYVTPQIYAFVDPSVDWRRYDDSARDSNGYRATAGLGTNQGIWAGELFGGYQAQENDVVGNYDSGVYGLRILYAPTRLWSVQGVVDETLSSVAIGGAPGAFAGTAAKVTNALLFVSYYGLPVGWRGNARFGYVHTTIINSPRRDDGWLAGINVGYEIWRNWQATFDYQYTTNESNIVGESFNKHLASLGVTYRY